MRNPFAPPQSSTLNPPSSQGSLDKWVLAPVVALVMLGSIMVYSSSFSEALHEFRNPSHFLERHLQYLVIGLVALAVCSRIDYRRLRRLSVPGMAIALLLLMVVAFSPFDSLTPSINGARRWLDLGFVQAQPSELAKLAFIIYAADWLSQKGEKVRNLWYGLVPFCIVLGVIVALIMLQPDLGTSLVFVAVGLTMFFVAGAHLGQLLGGAVVAAAAFVVLILTATYRMNRISIFLDPWRDPQGLGYQPIQGLYALGSGGFVGRGLGESRQKFSWLFAAHTDSIMAVVGEELGFVGSVLVVILVVTLGVRGYSVALRAPDAFGSLLAAGVTSWLVFQSALNIGVVTLTVPFTGIPLPFVSYGGSSLVVSLAAVGVLLSVSRRALPREEWERPRRRRPSHARAGRPAA